MHPDEVIYFKYNRDDKNNVPAGGALCYVGHLHFMLWENEVGRSHYESITRNGNCTL